MRAHIATLLALLSASPLALAAAETRKKVAVLEYRAGVEQAADLAQRLADRLTRTAALTVVDPQDARRRMPRADAEVARCAGDPACLSRLGAKLGVDEVLLVGVSQLGDLVITLQRVDVAEATVGARIAETIAADAELSDDQLASWLKKLYPPDVFKRYGYISVSCNVDGAAITINGQSRGETPLAGKVKVLAPRTYRVNISKDGYAPFTAKVDVPPDATFDVNADLVLEQAPLSWYKRWYLWAIVGGVVAASAIGTAVYLAQPDGSHVNGFIQR